MVPGGAVSLLRREGSSGRSWLPGMLEVFARLPVAVAYLAGRDLVFEFVNDEYRRLIGRDDVLGAPLREALP